MYEQFDGHSSVWNVTEISLFTINYEYSATASFLNHPEAHISARQTYLWSERHGCQSENKCSEEFISQLYILLLKEVY